MKKQIAVKIGLFIIMPFMLIGCKKSEPAPEQADSEIEVYESEDGWKLSYDTGAFFLNDTLGGGEICFNYTGECSGTTAVIVSYHPEMMPDEVLYEKVAGFDDALIERGEAMFGDYWSHYRNIFPENEDPNAGDVFYEDFTAIEHNDGTVLIDYLHHLETDDAQKAEVENAISGLLDSFELINHNPQTEYYYIPGKYTRQYTDEIGGDKIEIEDIIELNADHSCSLTFQDTVTGQWTGTKIILDNDTEYEFSVEGSTLYLNMDGDWVPFENTNYGYPTGGNEIRYIMETIDLENLPDGTYPVKVDFDAMKRNQDSLALDFMIYTVVRYAPEDIRNMKRDDIIYEYVDEVTTENYIVDTVNFPLDEVCVVNGGSERGEGITFSLDKSGYFIVSVAEGYTRHAAHGMVTLEVPDSVTFEDNHDLENAKLNGDKLYDYFKGLSSTEKEYFNENNTFITVSKGKITKFYRIYLP